MKDEMSRNSIVQINKDLEDIKKDLEKLEDKVNKQEWLCLKNY